jgi:hypothetical protein
MARQKSIWMTLLAFCLVALSGCAAMPPAPKTWYKEGATEEQFRRDMMYCRQYGMQSAQSNGLAGNMFVESWVQREANNCLTGLGYR